MKKKIIKAVCIAAGIIAAICIVFGIYVSDYYRAGETAVTALSAENVTLTESRAVFRSDNADTGLIFYPGGKVEFTAYAPLMLKLSEMGITCIIVKMPFNLAVFDISAASDIFEQYPEISNWYIGGHSLGGSMAASYAAENAENIKGIILLAAYSTADLSGSGIAVLSVYGSEDGVLNMEKYEAYAVNLPDGHTENIIEGGCHAYFGDYGSQKGDGEPEISCEEQTDIAAGIIFDFVQGMIEGQKTDTYGEYTDENG